MLSALRPHLRRLVILVLAAAAAGVALGELAPAHPGAPTKTSKVGHGGQPSHERAPR